LLYFAAKRGDARQVAASEFDKAIACPQIHDMDPDMRSIPDHLAQGFGRQEILPVCWFAR
jgi:hypothetical protein